MQQWEYTIPLYSNLELMGLDGWELCGIMEGKHVFKRPIGPNWEAMCEAAEAYFNEPTREHWDKWQELKNKT